MCEPFGGYQTAIAGAPREARMFDAEQRASRRRVNAIGSHHGVGDHSLAVLEFDFDAIAAVDPCRQSMSEVQIRRWHRLLENPQEIGAMHLIVRGSEGMLHDVGKGRAQQRSTVLPVALM